MCAVTKTGAVAQTYFYSTSCGFGAGSQEVWSKDGSFSGRGKSYLQAQTYGDFAPPQTGRNGLPSGRIGRNRVRYEFTVVSLEGVFQMRHRNLQKTLAESANCRIEGIKMIWQVDRCIAVTAEDRVDLQ